MPRRSLRPHLNQIRAWVRQGRTDAWVAHQLEVTVQDIENFKQQNELEGGEETAKDLPAGEFPEEVNLRAADDELIAAELEAAAARRAEEEEQAPAVEDNEPQESEEGAEGASARRRGRRGGRGRRSSGSSGARLEGTFDHGEEGYGLWLDPAIQDDPVYAEHWAGHRPVEVTVEEDKIVIRRAGEDG
ncbi:MAG TPA: hypothetical protein VIC05_07505 [Solirubrobacteraceae bacterium]|jgi:hypothetical protein